MPSINASYPVQSLAMGRDHTCAFYTPFPSKVMCWGSDEFGQLGNGDPLEDSLIPVTAAKCWGNNADGRVGNGSSGGPVTTAVDVIALP